MIYKQVLTSALKGQLYTVTDSLGLRAGREQCWSSQDTVDRHKSSTLAVDTIALKDSNSGSMIILN